MAALLAVPGSVAAQDSSTEAAAAFDQGTQYFGRGQYALALESFRVAYRLRAHPAVLFNIATCLDRLGRAQEAVAEYLRYRRLRGSGIEPERRRYVEEALRRLGPQVALMLVTAPSPDALVAVDGTIVEIGEDPLVLLPGPHLVESRAPDGRYTRTDVNAVGGQMHNVVLRFPVPRNSEDPGPSSEPIGPGPESPFHREGPESPAPVDRMPRDREGWDPSLRWIGLGATVVFGGLMIYTGARTLSLEAEYRDDPTDEGARDEGLTYKAVTEFVFFPATLVAAGFTVLAFVFAEDTDERAPPAASAALVPLPHGLALAASGRF